MKRLIALGTAAALGTLGLVGLVSHSSPVTAAADCTISVHLAVDLNGTGQGQDLCIPEGLGAPSLPA